MEWADGLYDGPVPLRMSQRHSEIMRLVCQGYSSTQISKILYLAPETIKGYRRDIRERLGARNAAHAACIYLFLLSRGQLEEA